MIILPLCLQVTITKAVSDIVGDAHRKTLQEYLGK